MIANQASGSSNSLPSASESRVSYFLTKPIKLARLRKWTPWGKINYTAASASKVRLRGALSGSEG